MVSLSLSVTLIKYSHNKVHSDIMSENCALYRLTTEQVMC